MHSRRVALTTNRPPRRLGPLIAATVVASLLVTVGLAYGIHRVPAGVDLAGPVFGGIVTIVALILPAAALANAYIENRITDYVQEPRSAELARLFRKVVDAVSLLPIAFGCFIVALMLSICALFHFDATVRVDPLNGLLVGDVLLAAALALMLVGVFLLLPLLFQMLDRRLAVKTLTLLEATSTPPAPPASG